MLHLGFISLPQSMRTYLQPRLRQPSSDFLGGHLCETCTLDRLIVFDVVTIDQLVFYTSSLMLPENKRHVNGCSFNRVNKTHH